MDTIADSSDEMPWGWQSKIKTIAERGRHILGTDLLSDVIFRAGPKYGETVDINAHKTVTVTSENRFLLAMGSAVFETMFYGKFPETKSIVPITDIDPDSFRVLLRYLYHDQIGPLNDTTAFPTLYAAKKYGLPILKDACEGYLRANIATQNCLAWFVQFWYASDTLPGTFITSRRHISTELHIARFGGTQDGWEYPPEWGWDVKPNAIKLCITSITDKRNRNVDLPSVSLVAVGLYLPSEIPCVQHPSSRGHARSYRGHYARRRGGYGGSWSQPSDSSVSAWQSGPPNPSIFMPFKVYVEEEAHKRQLAQFVQTIRPPGGQTGDRVHKLALSRPVPLEIHQRYIVSADIWGTQKSFYGTEGRCSVTTATSSGDLNVTVQFASVLESHTTVAQGQFPEFYFEIVG